MTRITQNFRTLCLASLAFLSLTVGASVNAADVVFGDLTISDAHSRATPPGAITAAGFMTIRNNGITADRLLGGTSVFAEVTELHQMSNSAGLMKMRQITDGLEIPPGGEVKLQSGGYHIMFMGIAQHLTEGEEVQITLFFEKAGKVVVVLPVVAIAGH